MVICLSDERISYDKFRGCVDSESMGAACVSVGLVSNFADIHTFCRFAKTLCEA